MTSAALPPAPDALESALQHLTEIQKLLSSLSSFQNNTRKSFFDFFSNPNKQRKSHFEYYHATEFYEVQHYHVQKARISSVIEAQKI